ncbi:unnamed protein product [Brassicogethes aeneus]|uniref:Uncharacterized protein n=1 Tax=Brassicogethes aeneus TaxID=1431903 RepID=A0A9P0B6E6_BRAAE|nr:unnamed protein product [Brassicogethes aeneus]
MRTKNFLVFVCSMVLVSLFLIIFGQHKPETIQNIVTSTNQQFKNFKDNLRDVQRKKLIADEKYLKILGFTENPRKFPDDVWKNTTLPVIVTYVTEGHHSQAIGLINNVARVLPNNTILVYNLGLSDYSLKSCLNHCNSSRCQVMTFDLSLFPSHVNDENSKAFRPLVIQDALSRTGAIFFLESNYRMVRYVTAQTIFSLYNETVTGRGVTAWPMQLKNPVSSLTHKKMFEYFRTDVENFQFLQMVEADYLILVNKPTVRADLMLPWVQCALTSDCIVPIGAQSAGCKFDKRPLYRYSGCHSYDVSAMNIALGLKYRLEEYSYNEPDDLFEAVSLSKANAELKILELNSTTDGRTVQTEML